MIVQMLFIKMCRDQHLIPVAPELFGKFDADLMTHLRRDLARFEALIRMIGYIASGLSERLLNCRHLFKGGVCIAPDAGGEIDFFITESRFFSVDCVADGGFQVIIFCFLRIRSIFRDPSQTVLDRPYLSRCHLMILLSFLPF